MKQKKKTLNKEDKKIEQEKNINVKYIKKRSQKIDVLNKKTKI